jgi:hypothetical protein
MVIAPSLIDPLPTMRNATNLGSDKKRRKPSPVVALTCGAVVTFSTLICFPFFD